MFSALDHQYMSRALQLAAQGLYTTSPNPRVGCVIVNALQNIVIGEGAHLKAGQPHAEVFALRQAGEAARDATLYVTLEPCNHHGKTPPCVDALIQARVSRVVVAMQDPNPLVAGQGVASLRAQGITVEVGLMEAEANTLNPGFIKRMTYGMPYVRSKIAASLDGKTALNNGASQWITGEPARLDVQHWRAQSCAILTGVGSVIADNPSLNVRLEGAARQPLRVIVDRDLQTPVGAKMLSLAGDTLIAYAHDKDNRLGALSHVGAVLLQVPAEKNSDKKSRVDLSALLKALAQRGVNEILLEAGQGLNGAFLQAGLIDEFIFYYAPKLMGADAKGMFAINEFTHMQQTIDLQITDIRQFGQDIRLRAKPIYQS